MVVSYFPAKCSFLNYIVFVQFIEIKYAEHDHTLQTVKTEFETTTSRLSKIVMNTCFHHYVQYKHKQNHGET